MKKLGKDPRLRGVFEKSMSLWFQRRTPEHLIPYVDGKRNLMVNLHTLDREEAIQRVDEARMRVHSILEDAQRQYELDKAQIDWLDEQQEGALQEN